MLRRVGPLHVADNLVSTAPYRSAHPAAGAADEQLGPCQDRLAGATADRYVAPLRVHDAPHDPQDTSHIALVDNGDKITSVAVSRDERQQDGPSPTRPTEQTVNPTALLVSRDGARDDPRHFSPPV